MCWFMWTTFDDSLILLLLEITFWLFCNDVAEYTREDGVLSSSILIKEFWDNGLYVEAHKVYIDETSRVLFIFKIDSLLGYVRDE